MTIKGSGGGGGCFPSGVKVLTPCGETPIELIQIGDEVLSFNFDGIVEISTVTNIFVHESLPTIIVKYWGGELRTTTNHWVLNQYNSFVEVGTLTELDAIVDQLGHLRPVLEIVPDSAEPVYNLHVSKNHTFIADGIRVHNGGLGLRTPIIGSGGGGGGKGGGGSSRTPIESADSLRSQQYANIVDLISEGEIAGLVNGAQSIFFENTPLQNSNLSYNFSGVSYATRNGTQAQTYIPGFSQIESEQAVSVKITYGVPVVRQITNSDVNSARITIAIPTLSSTSVSTGDVTGTSVTMQIELQSNGGGYVVQNLNGSEVISGKASSRYQRSYEIQLTGSAPWDIRVSRLTADSTTQYLQNQTWWDSYTEVIDSKLTYPNSALVALSVDSSQFNSIPTRGYLMKGLKIRVPDNYNPITRAYTGVWLGSFQTVWSDNPAWVFYDLVTNSRYGLGEFVNPASVDIGTLYQIAQYCDELVPDGYGGVEPRYTCNLYLQSRDEAFHVLANIASIFAGMVYWSNGLITASIDKPATKIYQFTNGNVVDGVFEYSGSSQTSRHTVALVSWNDPNDKYTQKIEYVEDSEGIALWGVRETEVVSIGCTSRGQAHRMGKRILLTERYLTETVSFKTGLEASNVFPGALIGIQDNNRSGGRYAGRISAATINTITLDSSITLVVGETYAITVVLANGTIEERTVTNGAGAYTTLNVSPNFASVPETQSIWVLSSLSLNTQLFTVIGVKESDKTTWDITALQYNPSKFAAVDADAHFQPLDTSNITSATIDAPTNLTITEGLYRSSVSTVDGLMNVSWSAVTNSFLDHYVVSWRYTNGNWDILPDTRNTFIEVAPILPGTVEVGVYAVSIVGIKSATTFVTATLLGKTAPPADVTNFNIQNISQTTYLSWTPIADLDANYYEIRYSPDLIGASWASSSPLVTNITHPTAITAVASLTGTYFIKAFDTSGNESINATAITSNVYDINQYNVISNLVEQTTFAGTKTNVEVISGTLQLSGSMMNTWTSLASINYLRIGNSLASTGTYNFYNALDLGGVYTSRVSSTLKIYGSNLINVMSTWLTLVQANPLTGTSGSTWSAALQFRTTNDNPAGTPVWSAWTDFTIGEYTCRAYQFRIILNSFSAYVTPIVEKLEIGVDMPDRVDGTNDLVCGVTGTTVTYSPAFMVSPALAIAAQGLTTGDYYVITAKSSTGFTIQFFNSSNVAIVRTFDWVAKGYGYVI